jgi:hypothetical protein
MMPTGAPVSRRRRRRLRPDLPHWALRYLIAVWVMAEERRPITFRGLMRFCDDESPHAPMRALRLLRGHGLVTWERRTCGKGSGTAGTIRPTCRLELWA